MKERHERKSDLEKCLTSENVDASESSDTDLNVVDGLYAIAHAINNLAETLREISSRENK